LRSDVAEHLVYARPMPHRRGLGLYGVRRSVSIVDERVHQVSGNRMQVQKNGCNIYHVEPTLNAFFMLTLTDSKSVWPESGQDLATIFNFQVAIALLQMFSHAVQWPS
jgi:hypothetical protein